MSQDNVHKSQLLKRKESRSKFEPRSFCLPAYRLMVSVDVKHHVYLLTVHSSLLLRVSYSLSLICQPDIRGHEVPHHHHCALEAATALAGALSILTQGYSSVSVNSKAMVSMENTAALGCCSRSFCIALFSSL